MSDTTYDRDLLGDPLQDTNTVVAFHDERMFQNWLYHGFLIVEKVNWHTLCALLDDLRLYTDCHKPVHFVELTGRGSISSRTRLASKWAEALGKEMLGMVRFSLLGVNLNRIDRSLFGAGSSSRSECEMRIYNRFVEIGLYSTLRWFFVDQQRVELRRIYVEKRDLPRNDPFPTHSPYRINKRQSNIFVVCGRVNMLDAKTTTASFYSHLHDCLQIADVLTGGFSQVLDNANSKAGCCEVANELVPLLERIAKNPYDKVQAFYKRILLNFFPKALTGSDLFDDTKLRDLMYNQRTLRYVDSMNQPMLLL